MALYFHGITVTFPSMVSPSISELLEELEWGHTGSILYMWLLEARLAHEKNSKRICQMSKLMLKKALRNSGRIHCIRHTHIIPCINYTYTPAMSKNRQNLEGLTDIKTSILGIIKLI